MLISVYIIVKYYHRTLIITYQDLIKSPITVIGKQERKKRVYIYRLHGFLLGQDAGLSKG